MASKPQLRLPKSAIGGFAAVYHCTDNEFQQVVSALQDVHPALYERDLISQVIDRIPVDSALVEKVIEVAMGLYLFTRNYKKEKQAAIDEVCQALIEMEDERLSGLPDNLDKLKHRLGELLELERSIGITSKAADVLTEHQHVYRSGMSRIVSDIRPIFSNDISEQPTAAVVVHTLKLAYQEDGETKEFYLALDTHDLQELQELLSRAKTKAATLNVIIQTAGMKALGPTEEITDATTL